jgi:imidazolonepropionase-like amidohydrolase/ABC-type multidrug transport system permease subunit
MKSILTQIRMTLRLTLREPSVLVFGYVFPLIFYFIFAVTNRAEQGGVIASVLASVLVIGILGNGLFGGGMRMTADRESNILRRFKVAPISALPILIASMVVSLVAYLPSALMVFILSSTIYKMPVPHKWLSLAIFIIAGVIAFRAIGAIVASTVNNMQEAQIVTQLLYFPMMFLSGATFPLTFFPDWLQIVAQFVPATHLSAGIQAILIKGESIVDNWQPLAAMLLTTFVGTFISLKLFRWEKGEKLKPGAKLWVLGVLAPFFLVGIWQGYSKQNVARAKVIERQQRRGRTTLIKDCRVFIGDGRVLERGAVLVKNGRIHQVFEGSSPSAESLQAVAIEGAGKTLLPGLIDSHVHIGATGGIFENPRDYAQSGGEKRALAAYLFSGVTAVRSTGDWIDQTLELRKTLRSAEYLGADLYTTGPLFTAEGGHPTQMLRWMPDSMKAQARAQFVRIPKSESEARQMVRELKARGVDAIKAVMEGGFPGQAMPRLDPALLRAIGAEAANVKLPLIVHTGTAADIRAAIEAGAASVEHGSMTELIPEEVFAAMKARGVAYDPTLSVADATVEFAAGSVRLLESSLIQQAAPAVILRQTRAMVTSPKTKEWRDEMARSGVRLDVPMQNLKRAADAGVLLIAGSDAGNPLVLHGPTVQNELALWVKAGLSPAVGIQAATANGARVLGAGDRFGRIQPGLEANLLLVDGNPLAEITALERISQVYFQGERVYRQDLFEQK